MRAICLAFALAAALPAVPAFAADPAVGRKLVAEKKCESCHAAKVPGAPGAIYLRKDRRVQSPENLKARVAMCNSELNLGLFPEDEEHIVAYLNATYYKFPKR